MQDQGESGTPRPQGRRRDVPHPRNLAEQMVAPGLVNRESECVAGCGSFAGAEAGCSSVGPLDQLRSDFVYSDGRRIVEVSYKGNRREFVEVADADLSLRVQDLVIVDGDRGVDIGSVSMIGSLVHAKRKAKKLCGDRLPQLLRRAAAQDIETHAHDAEAERKALDVCRERVAHFELPMNLVGAEWQFDHRRITFYFTADGRVDFRELVRDLASIFHTRIELRQIAVRDEAKRIGGMGICGRELCCTTYLGRYEHITLDHAKAQQLQINPTKLSGLCGRLKCCLLFEIDAYVDGLRRFPPLDSTITTSVGKGVVQKIDVFRDLLYVYHAEQHDMEILTLGEVAELISRHDRAHRNPAPEAAQEH